MRRAALGLAGLVHLVAAVGAAPARETRAILAAVSRVEKRVRPRVRALLEAQGLAYPPGDVFLRVFKLEEELELWARDGDAGPFRLVKTYRTHPLPCNYRRGQPASLAAAGPKRRQGDLRVPEGLYRILYHNPWSTFYLSLAVDYPNPSDAIMGRSRGTIGEAGERAVLSWWRDHGPAVRTSLIEGVPALWRDRAAYPLGNEIFIHGKTVSIGCVPIGDPAIEEVFVLTDARRVGGTEVHFLPLRFDDPRNRELRKAFEGQDASLAAFWRSLERVYRVFERTRELPALWIDRRTGLYSLTGGADKVRY